MGCPLGKETSYFKGCAHSSPSALVTFQCVPMAISNMSRFIIVIGRKATLT